MIEMQEDEDSRRRHPRAAVRGTLVVFARQRCEGPFRIENLSVGGALVAGDAKLHVGEWVRLLLILPGQRPLGVRAEVRRSERGRAGAGRPLFAVEFHFTTPTFVAAVHDSVVAALRERLASLPPVDHAA